ncbi:putative holin-like toxin [Shouchella lonarensis]
MTTFQVLMLMIAFAGLMVSVTSRDNK